MQNNTQLISKFLDACEDVSQKGLPLVSLVAKLQSFAVDHGFTHWYNAHLHDLLKRGSFELVNVDASYLVLFDSPLYSVELLKLGRRTKYLYRYPAEALYVNLSAVSIACDQYEVNAGATALNFKARQHIAPFATIFRDGEHGCLDFIVPQNETRLVARILLPNRSAHEIAFERDKLQHRTTITTDQVASYTYCMTEFAGVLGHPRLSQGLQVVARKNKDGWVRWRAVKNLARIDTAACCDLLDELSNDADPQIKAIAISTVAANPRSVS
ncbi:MAG: hypothetical protein V4476_11460 [Pseudomonadota bacterium]